MEKMDLVSNNRPTGDQVCSQANQRLLVKDHQMPICYVTYFRVSTQRQGASGLGLDAQRKAVSQYAEANGGTMLASFVEVESGKRSDRPELQKAIASCRKSGAVLLIAKLDRLARNVHFISGLIESGVSFIATDMPNADRFMLHVYAAMAEEEARRISDRTKRALAAAKARGIELGKNGKQLARLNRTEADSFARVAGKEVSRLRSTMCMTFQEVADHLNLSQSLPTQRGGKWHQATVYRVFKRYEALEASPTAV
ncbi:recombinase family protein [Loktanella agnita]|uniref:recombinase family protein n=1 Tax=Loktanella agnita TaxID=287097 RepID=UPI00398724A2